MCSNFLTELVQNQEFRFRCAVVSRSRTTEVPSPHRNRLTMVFVGLAFWTVYVSVVVIRVTDETDVPTTHFISGIRVRCVYFGMTFFIRISVEGHFSQSTSHHRHACTSFEISVVSLVGSKQRHRTCDFCFRCALGTLERICSGWPKNCRRWRTGSGTTGNSRMRCFTVRRS